jgi:hypothetical protein
VLAGAGIRADYLGAKENVIIALIPAGTGFPGEEVVLHDERLEGERPLELMPGAEAEPLLEEPIPGAESVAAD